MNLTVHIPGFGQMFGVPNAVVDQYLKLATPSQLKVLLYLLRNNGQTVDHSEIAKALAISEELVEEAALFWSQTRRRKASRQRPQPNRNRNRRKPHVPTMFLRFPAARAAI